MNVASQHCHVSKYAIIGGKDMVCQGYIKQSVYEPFCN